MKLSRTMHIPLTERGIEQAIKALERVQNAVCNTSNIVKRLCEEGAEIAQRENKLPTEIVMVSDGASETTAVIRQEGKDVIFREFGAGYEVADYNPLAEQVGSQLPYGVETASFSRQEVLEGGGKGLFYVTDQMYPGHGYWRSGGVTYEGDDGYKVFPHNGMAYAFDEIRNRAIDIALEEVLKG